jgi:hypothetical protein
MQLGVKINIEEVFMKKIRTIYLVSDKFPAVQHLHKSRVTKAIQTSGSRFDLVNMQIHINLLTC